MIEKLANRKTLAIAAALSLGAAGCGNSMKTKTVLPAETISPKQAREYRLHEEAQAKATMETEIAETKDDRKRARVYAHATRLILHAQTSETAKREVLLDAVCEQVPKTIKNTQKYGDYAYFREPAINLRFIEGENEKLLGLTPAEAADQVDDPYHALLRSAQAHCPENISAYILPSEG